MNSEGDPEIATTDILSVKISTLNLIETIEIFKKWINLGAKKRVCVTQSIVFSGRTRTLTFVTSTTLQQ